MTSTGQFSVCRFFATGAYEYACRYVGAAEAYETAWRLAISPCAPEGITTRVIITDGGDCTVWDWEDGKGVVFPEGWTLESGPPAQSKTTPEKSSAHER
jgi:hypothetical protein